MARHVLIALVNPVKGQEDEFKEWYRRQHMGDILATPAGVSARLFRSHEELTDVKGNKFQYIAIYEFDSDDFPATIEAMRKLAGTDKMPHSDTLDLTTSGFVFGEAMTELMTKS